MDHQKKHPKVKDHQNRNRSTAQPLEFRLQVIFHALALPALPALPAATRRRRAGLRINCTSTGLGSCGAVLQHVLSTTWTRLWTGSITCVATGGDESALCFAIVKSTRRLCHPHAVAAGDPPQRHIDTSWKSLAKRAKKRAETSRFAEQVAGKSSKSSANKDRTQYATQFS